MHWRRKWQPTPMFLPGESQGRGSLVGGKIPWRRKCQPLQYSCLENPRDGGWSWCPPWSMVPTLVHGACLGPWCLPWSWSQPWSALPPCDRLSPWDGTLGSVLSEAQLREEPVPFSLTRQCEPRACPRLCPGSAEAACRGLYLLMESRLWPSLRVQGQRGPAAQRLPTLEGKGKSLCPVFSGFVASPVV